jgi:periplasmic protein TonB
VREFAAYLLSAVLHVSVLGVLNSALNEPPQLLRVEMGRASVEAVAAHASKPVGVVDPDTSLLDESVAGIEHPPVPMELDAEKLDVAKQTPQFELTRRDTTHDDAVVPLPPPPPRKPMDEPPRPVEPMALEKKQARLPKVEEIAEVVAEASVASAPSRAQLGAEDDDLPPTLVTNPAPPYPPEARAAGQRGVVVLLVTINVAGTVDKTSLYTSSGVASLDQAALAAVPHWRFQPGRRHGVPSTYDVRVPVRFSIRN